MPFRYSEKRVCFYFRSVGIILRMEVKKKKKKKSFKYIYADDFFLRSIHNNHQYDIGNYVSVHKRKIIENNFNNNETLTKLFKLKTIGHFFLFQKSQKGINVEKERNEKKEWLKKTVPFFYFPDAHTR